MPGLREHVVQIQCDLSVYVFHLSFKTPNPDRCLKPKDFWELATWSILFQKEENEDCFIRYDLSTVDTRLLLKLNFMTVIHLYNLTRTHMHEVTLILVQQPPLSAEFVFQDPSGCLKLKSVPNSKYAMFFPIHTYDQV